MDHLRRRNTLVERCAALDVDALLVTKLANVRYLTGFTGSPRIGARRAGRLGVLHRRPLRQAIPARGPRRHPCGVDGEPAGAILDHARRLGVERLGFESHRSPSPSSGGERSTASSSPGSRRRSTAPLGEGCRGARGPSIGARRDQRRVEDILEVLIVGITERQAAAQLELAMSRARRRRAVLRRDRRVRRARRRAAPPAVSSSARRGRRDQDGLRRVGRRVPRGLHRDRRFRRAGRELRKVHDIVAAAQQAGIDALRAGVLAADVDRAARSVIEDAGTATASRTASGTGSASRSTKVRPCVSAARTSCPRVPWSPSRPGRVPARPRRGADRGRRRGDR